MVRTILKWIGLSLCITCGLVLMLGLIMSSQLIHNEYYHQSGIRWLAEGTVAGLLLAAIGFWENE